MSSSGKSELHILYESGLQADGELLFPLSKTDIEGDGNCFFASLCRLKPVKEKDPNSLRKTIAEYGSRNPQLITNMIQIGIIDDDRSVDEVLEVLSTEGRWAGTVASILFTSLFRIKIKVIHCRKAKNHDFAVLSDSSYELKRVVENSGAKKRKLKFLKPVLYLLYHPCGCPLSDLTFRNHYTSSFVFPAQPTDYSNSAARF